MKPAFIIKLGHIWNLVEKKLMPSYVWAADPLTFWRERILFILCFITAAFAIFPLIPSVILSYQEGLWNVILLDCIAYASMVFLLLVKHWSLRVRGYFACLIFYGLGVGLLFIIGPHGAGYIWLFGASIMVSAIIGLEAALWILLVNTITLVSASFYAAYGGPAWAASLGTPLQKMLVLTGNFLFFNTFVTVTTGFMLNGLKKALENEQAVSANLRKSEERYRIVADFNYDWEYWIGPDGSLEYVSPSCELITGYCVADYLKKPDLMLSIVYPEDRPRVAAHLKSDLSDSQGADSIDFRIIAADQQGHPKENQKIRWISHYCQPVYNDAGTFWGRRVSNRDITDRKNVEDTNRLHHERFLTVLDSIDASIYVADLHNYEVLFMNKHMIESYGKDMTGDTCWRAFRNATAPCDWCQKHRQEDNQGEAISAHGWQEQNPITQRWYVNFDRIIKWTDGRPVKIQIATDITELKKMEAELRQTHKMEAIGALAGGIAHDFNNILSAIIGYTELALDDVRKGTLLESNLQEVFTAGKRAKDLVRQILAFARQSDEKVKPLIVSPIAKEALKLIRSSIPTTIEIQQNIASNAMILGSPTQVHQIIMNLCTNAAHAMEKSGGRLSVELTDVHIAQAMPEPHSKLGPGNYLKLSVADSGVGIAPEVLPLIFEPYFTTKGPGEGTGMGLAVVQGIVESYGGKITVQSQVGKGTIFTIYLPVSKERIEEVALTQSEYPTGMERILLVDDELPIAKVGCLTLERLGYKVTTQNSSRQALVLFSSNPQAFDLVLTDMTMPELTGEQLAAEMMRIRPDIPVILCTGYSKQISDELALKNGIKALAYKPIIKKELAEIVRKVLDEHGKARVPPPGSDRSKAIPVM